MALTLRSGILRQIGTFQQQQRYSSATVLSGKAAAKAYFQQRYGLGVEPGMPLVGMVGRLAAQKGTDVVLAALPALLPLANDELPAGHPNNGICTCCSLPLQGRAKPLQIALLGSGWSPAVVSGDSASYIARDSVCCILQLLCSRRQRCCIAYDSTCCVAQVVACCFA